MALLEATGIVKSFGKLTALNGAALSIADNEFHGLIGPNGSGKSTLLRWLSSSNISIWRCRWPTAPMYSIGAGSRCRVHRTNCESIVAC
jgi:ABC-type phosphate/phosphonate transport system ATPase subunit